MKKLSFRRVRLFPLHRAGAALLVLLAANVRLPADEPATPPPSLQIGVRSSVDERWEGFKKKGAIAHGRVYGIAAIKEVPATTKLVKSLDENRLLQLLRTELNTRGFTEITPAQKPDVVLTVLYGRGWLRNPYLRGAMVNEDSEAVPVATMTLPDQVLREREPGYEAKLQAAQQEKLFIKVTAYKYPETKGEKPALLWTTTMVVDDPDNRDLNQVAKELLAAGAGYFDQMIRDEEVLVSTLSPQGHVILHPLRFLDDKPATK